MIVVDLIFERGSSNMTKQDGVRKVASYRAAGGTHDAITILESLLDGPLLGSVSQPAR